MKTIEPITPLFPEGYEKALVNEFLYLLRNMKKYREKHPSGPVYGALEMFDTADYRVRVDIRITPEKEGNTELA
ncbi:hypothetical protein [Nitrolancea hollandica]|uniref:Uncharacterized protein n=1 Tax=Nitrolancea hollandica Lb TaxID=1129897 RepID=I4EFK1_9BACT|nr:hypothetical protein [Nitrolancea hollandica]CCF83463.1 hypothetical protein NITHO_2310006 [Nitrolancea hollandica Lb]